MPINQVENKKIPFQLQLTKLHQELDHLQSIYGDLGLKPIYGAGQINNPQLLFLFMNPTGRNISASPDWSGLRAPWLGTKNIWKLLSSLGLISLSTYQHTQNLLPQDWSPSFSEQIYQELKNNSVYITNLAKCTQLDSRPLKNNVFQAYLKNTLKEIYQINPQKIISFGNQVSSILLAQNIQVSKYQKLDQETLSIKVLQIAVFPVFYPVGQGLRNLPKAIARIKKIMK